MPKHEADYIDFSQKTSRGHVENLRSFVINLQIRSDIEDGELRRSENFYFDRGHREEQRQHMLAGKELFDGIQERKGWEQTEHVIIRGVIRRGGAELMSTRLPGFVDIWGNGELRRNGFLERVINSPRVSVHGERGRTKHPRDL